MQEIPRWLWSILPIATLWIGWVTGTLLRNQKPMIKLELTIEGLGKAIEEWKKTIEGERIANENRRHDFRKEMSDKFSEIWLKMDDMSMSIAKMEGALEK